MLMQPRYTLSELPSGLSKQLGPFYQFHMQLLSIPTWFCHILYCTFPAVLWGQLGVGRSLKHLLLKTCHFPHYWIVCTLSVPSVTITFPLCCQLNNSSMTYWIPPIHCPFQPPYPWPRSIHKKMEDPQQNVPVAIEELLLQHLVGLDHHFHYCSLVWGGSK